MKTTRRQFVAAAATGMAGVGAVESGAPDDKLQAIIDQGLILDLQPGTYTLTKPLVLDTTRSGYAGIRGPQGAARLIMTAPGPAVRVVGNHLGTASPPSVQAHTWDQERFPILSGFEIVGAHPEADGIELIRTMQPVVERVLIRKCRYGIHLADRNRNIIIANCQIYDNSDTGIFMDNVNLHQVNIIGNHISYCRRAGIRQWNGDVHNIQITGNDIEYNAGSEGGLSGEIVLEAPDGGMISEFTISSNTIQAVPGDAGANVAIVCGDNGGAVGLLAITGNVLGSRNMNVLVRNAHDGITITGNTIYTGVDGNVVLDRCSNILVNGNTIQPSSEGGPDFKDRGGVRFTGCEACILSDNIIAARIEGEPPAAVVSLTGCRAVAVSCNQILNVLQRGLYLRDCTHCRVSGNTILPHAGRTDFTAVLAESAGEGNIVRDNSPADQ